jgi:hypothetical protein
MTESASGPCTMTTQPHSASRRAISQPMPEAAAVTSAVRRMAETAVENTTTPGQLKESKKGGRETEEKGIESAVRVRRSGG